jgi:hypothetical protein
VTVLIPAFLLMLNAATLPWLTYKLVRGESPVTPSEGAAIAGALVYALLLCLGGFLDCFWHPAAMLAVLYLVIAFVAGASRSDSRYSPVGAIVGTLILEFLLFWAGFYDDLLTAVGVSL